MRELQIAELCFVSGGGVFCGPSGSWLNNFIPDKPFGADFSVACKRHDDRYLAGTEARSLIDADFRNDMLNAAGSNPLGIAMAYVYYGAVSVFGGFFYGPSNSAVVATDAQAAEVAQSTVDYAVGHGLDDDILVSVSATGIDSSFTNRVSSGVANHVWIPRYVNALQSVPPGELAVA